MLYPFETLKQVIDMCVDTYADHFVSNVPLASGRIAVLSEEISSFGGTFYRAEICESDGTTIEFLTTDDGADIADGIERLGLLVDTYGDEIAFND